MNTTGKADLGQCFIAVDPDCFAPGFKERMSDLMSYLRNMDPVRAELTVKKRFREFISFEGGSQ